MSSESSSKKQEFGPDQIIQLNADLPDSAITLFLPGEYDRSLLPIKARALRNWWEADDKTKMHARFCLPLTMASGLGYYILSPATFTVEWDGDVTHDTVIEIIEGCSHTQIDNHSSHGSFTVQSAFIARTKNIGDFVYIKGVANQERPPFNVLEAMIESWWSPSTFGIVCVVNRAGKFQINKGEPLAQMFVTSSQQAEYSLSIKDGYPPFWDEWNERRRPDIYNGRNMDYLRGLLPDQTPVCPHFQSWSKSKSDESDAELQFSQHWATGDHARAVGSLDEAVRHYLRALQVAEERGELSAERLKLAQQIARDLKGVRQYVQSGRLLQRCADLSAKYFPEGLEIVAELPLELAYVHRMSGEYKHAQDVLELMIASSRERKDDMSLARALIDLGTLEDSLGHFDEARTALEEAFQIYSANLSDDDVQFLYLKNVFACLLTHAGKFEEALPLYNEVVKTRSQIFGEDSLQVGVTYNDLGFHYKLGRDVEQSERCFSKYLLILIDKYGDPHLDVASAHENLAWLFREVGHHQKAKSHIESALAIRKKLLPPKDDVLRGTYLTLADICAESGDLFGAQRFRREAQ